MATETRIRSEQVLWCTRVPQFSDTVQFITDCLYDTNLESRLFLVVPQAGMGSGYEADVILAR